MGWWGAATDPYEQCHQARRVQLQDESRLVFFMPWQFAACPPSTTYSTQT